MGFDMSTSILDIFGEEKQIQGKICNACNEFRTLDMYIKITRSEKSGLRSICKICTSSLNKKLKHFKKTYAVPDNHKCEICEKTKEEIEGRYTGTFVLDHSHTTDIVRGFICHDCNIGLGKFKDDPELLKKAIEYLEKYLNIVIDTHNHLCYKYDAKVVET